MLIQNEIEPAVSIAAQKLSTSTNFYYMRERERRADNIKLNPLKFQVFQVNLHVFSKLLKKRTYPFIKQKMAMGRLMNINITKN